MTAPSDNLNEAIGALLQAHDQQSAISHVRRLYPRLEEARQSGITYIKLSEAMNAAGVRMTPNTLTRSMARIRKERAQDKGRVDAVLPAASPVAPAASPVASAASPVVATPTPNPSQGAGVDPSPENTALASILDLSLSNEARHKAIGEFFKTSSEQRRIEKILKQRKQTP